MIRPEARERFERITSDFDALADMHGRDVYVICAERALGRDHRLARYARGVAEGRLAPMDFWRVFEGLSAAQMRRVLEETAAAAERLADYAEERADESLAALEAAKAEAARDAEVEEGRAAVHEPLDPADAPMATARAAMMAALPGKAANTLSQTMSAGPRHPTFEAALTARGAPLAANDKGTTDANS